MAWTDERVEKLRELWAEGLTASQIAKALSGVSRNAVIGKVHRLGLSNRAGGGKTPGGEADEEASVEVTESITIETVAEPTEPAVAPVAEIAAEAEAAETVNPIAMRAAEVERSARRLSLLELNERTCKWPIGDPSTDDFYFCGLNCAPEKPYCAAHVAVAYQPMSSRRDRDRSRNRMGAA